MQRGIALFVFLAIISISGLCESASRSPLTQEGDTSIPSPIVGEGRGEGDRIKTFMELSALQGSVLEHKMFEDDFGVESISTAKLFQICNQQPGCQLLTIDKTNISSVLPTLNVDDNVKADIQNSVNQNLIVRIPQSPITYKDWSGIGYIKENPQTGESGYMLSGMLASSSPDLSGIAGGMTAVSPEKWKSQYIVDILRNPYKNNYRSIVITSPKNDTTTTASLLNLRGTVLDPKAKVTVNGVEAYMEGNTFTASVRLNRGINTITATSTNQAGRKATDTIRVRYKVPLRTIITFPFDGLDISTPSIDIEGMVTDAEATVEVNGINAEVSADGRYIARGLTLTEGTNTITARATNKEGESDTQAIAVNHKKAQTAPLSISITSPSESSVINRPSVTIRGTVTTEAKEVSIKANGILAEVYNNQFVVNNVPLIDGDNVITVYAVDSNGATGRAEVTVKAVTTTPHITLNANMTSGIPDLTTYFTVTTDLPNAVTEYRMDFEGDGTIDYTGATFEDISHAYPAEGIYHPTVTVTDEKGNVYSDSIAVTVMNREKIETLLKAKWANMRTALMGGAVERALFDMTENSKDTYRKIFMKMSNEKINSMFLSNIDFELDVLYGMAAGCGAIRDESGELFSYPVSFVKDKNGNWKIRAF